MEASTSRTERSFFGAGTPTPKHGATYAAGLPDYSILGSPTTSYQWLMVGEITYRISDLLIGPVIGQPALGSNEPRLGNVPTNEQRNG